MPPKERHHGDEGTDIPQEASDSLGERTPQGLPIIEYRKEIEKCVEENDHSVIIGETGSGKTTRIPLFLLDQFPNAKIAVTQPRQIAAPQGPSPVPPHAG